MICRNEQLLQRLTSDFVQREASTTSNKRILQRVTSYFTTSNEQRVKSYTSLEVVQNLTKKYRIHYSTGFMSDRYSLDRHDGFQKKAHKLNIRFEYSN